MPIKLFDIGLALFYGGDETGIQSGIGTTEYVVGRKGKGVQHQQRDGNRENITVLPTICADGTNLVPAIIFKGYTDGKIDPNIHLLCYPSHSTHIYQGLDHVWSDEWDKFELNHGKVDKTNFMAIYARAHAAFAKTGIIPFNPNVISKQAMAPSLETSTSSTHLMPLGVASPVQEILALIAAHQ
ncbi:hypothetical protein BT96DRAFT_960643 [Gymnopus androsaceus JB14]|uniref:DDE-1 domain-containing protein n=1 Tax=Gymnopus androsaceus JB14 TaxID=1447944 RepID=A0A6A4GK92_9AGAR|nr:hypothetical protein BT96DRAFT_960643 [Gymnopus androsaceus JB14]